MATWTARLTNQRSSFGGPLAVVEGPMGERICDVPADPGQDPMPRALFIAGSQELLEALRHNAERNHLDSCPHEDQREGAADGCLNCITNAAIAKADPEPTEPAAWGRWAARNGWTRSDAEDVAIARFHMGRPLFPGDPSDVALTAYDESREGQARPPAAH